MSATKSRSSARKRAAESALLPEPDSKFRVGKEGDEDDFFDLDFSSDIKGIVSALHQIKEKAQKDGQKKNEETISSVGSEIKSIMDELKSKIERDRQSFAKALSKSSKECENCLKNEIEKFQDNYKKFCKEKEVHLQAMKDAISKYEEGKETMFLRYEQLRKKEKSMISEQEKVCADKITKLESSLKKKKKDDKTFSILRKTLGSFLENASDEDFPPYD